MDKEPIEDKKLLKYSFYRAGTKIFNQGDSGKNIYILKKGAVTVIVDNQMIGLINTPDTIIGEMAYFLNINRTASVEAVEDSDFIIISGEYLYDTVMKKPQIGIQLLKILSARLAKTTKYATKLEHEIAKYRNKIRKIEGAKDETKPTLLEELMAYGLISEEHVEKCNHELKKSKEQDSPKSVPNILIENKFITSEQLIQFLQMRQLT